MTLFRTLFLCSALLAGCTTAPQPENLEPVQSGGAYQAQYRDPPSRRAEQTPGLLSPGINAQKCRPPRGGEGGKGGGLDHLSLRGELLNRGDLLDIRVADDDTFTGDYEISRDGTVRLPFLAGIAAQGRGVDAIEADLTRALIDEGFYVSDPRVSVRVQDLSEISVSVSGAVFEARPVEIGRAGGDEMDPIRQAALGASTEARDLANAIRNAGGIRPDADLSAVELRRGGRTYTLDLRPVMEGRDRADIMLLTGDEVFVPSRLCFQEDLVKPSPISPPGVSLFLSNLTQPAAGNAQSAVGRTVREVPYGTRLMQAVVDSNCVGGARATSAHRSAALMSRNPISTVSVVIERDIEAMLRRADRDDYDPFLMPGDAIACYDSAVTNVAEVGRVMTGITAGLLLGN